MKSFDVQKPSFVRRAYCEKCNSRWMQEMDKAVAPLVCPMIRGAHVTLSKAEQQQVAAWAAKLALVGQSLAGERRAVPDTEYFRFYAERRPLAGYPIVLAHYTDRSVRHSVAMRTILVKDENHEITGSQAVMVTIVIGELIVQSLLVGHKPVLDPVIPRFDYLSTIWPVLGPVSWPPSIGIDDASLRVLSGEDME
jgi:hypothetical protein